MLKKLSINQELLLVFLVTKQDRYLDPARIMQGLFMFSMGASTKWNKYKYLYRFAPYQSGPCSPQIYIDLNVLIEYGYVKTEAVTYFSCSCYKLTDEGIMLSERLKRGMPFDTIEFLETTYEYIYNTNIYDILKTIHIKYPSFLTNNVFLFSS